MHVQTVEVMNVTMEDLLVAELRCIEGVPPHLSCPIGVDAVRRCLCVSLLYRGYSAQSDRTLAVKNRCVPWQRGPTYALWHLSPEDCWCVIVAPCTTMCVLVNTVYPGFWERVCVKRSRWRPLYRKCLHQSADTPSTLGSRVPPRPQSRCL